MKKSCHTSAKEDPTATASAPRAKFFSPVSPKAGLQCSKCFHREALARSKLVLGMFVNTKPKP